MTEVSFYHLQAQPLDQALPRLLEKVNERGMRALIRVKENELMMHLNASLWTFSANSFLAHGIDQDVVPEDQPLLLTTEHSGNVNNASVLVLLEDSAAPDVADFDRCLYMFDGNDLQNLQAARQRWTDMKAEGIDVTYWQQEAGGWKKKA